MRTTTRRGANHVLHLALSVMTCGLWAVTGWPIAAAVGRRTTVRTSEPVPAPPVYYWPQGVTLPQQPVQWPAAPSAYDRSGMPAHSAPHNPYRRPQR